MDILFCGNEKMFDGVLTAGLSIVKRMENPEPLTIHIFTMELTRVSPDYTAMNQQHTDIIENALRKHNAETFVKLYDVSHLYEEHLKENPNEGCYCSPYTLLRLLADLLPMPDKFLYLDADVMLCRDIRLLYRQDIADVEYAAARDHYGHFLIHPNYINAGVILFNMKCCRETGLFDQARKRLWAKKLPFADQSALARATTKRKVLPHYFNDQKFLYQNTVIRHFSKRLFYTPYPHTENIKQWHVEKVHQKFGYTCFDDILDEYLEIKEKYSRGANEYE